MSLDVFLARYPEFEQHDANRIVLFLSDAKAEMSESRWGDLYQRGLCALTAHLLYLDDLRRQSQGQAVKAVTSERAGELSVNFAMPTLTGSESDYQLSAYGQEYLRLRKLVGVGVMVV